MTKNQKPPEKENHKNSRELFIEHHETKLIRHVSKKELLQKKLENHAILSAVGKNKEAYLTDTNRIIYRTASALEKMFYGGEIDQSQVNAGRKLRNYYWASQASGKSSMPTSERTDGGKSETFAIENQVEALKKVNDALKFLELKSITKKYYSKSYQKKTKKKYMKVYKNYVEFAQYICFEELSISLLQKYIKTDYYKMKEDIKIFLDLLKKYYNS